MHSIYKKSIAFLALIFFLSLSQQLPAQTTGKITGQVLDAETGDPLPGVNILLLNTRLGAAADANGDFYIINIPPGNYTVQARMIGYKPVNWENVTVSVNRSSNLAIKMQHTVLEGEEIYVYASQVSIKKDQTSSIKNISTQEISLLPVQTVNEVIQMQAGVVDGHFRGGRINEVSYLIDGIPVDEVFQGEKSSINLEKEVVQDLEVITGTFNAEYGKAMSGIVNMVTKDGGNQFHGSAYIHAGNYITGNKDIFTGLKNSHFDRIMEYKAQLEGPIFKNTLSFIANIRHVKDDSYINGIHYFNPGDYSNFSTPDILGDVTTPWDANINGMKYYSEHTGDSSHVPINDTQSTSFFGKLTFKPLNHIKLGLVYTKNNHEGPLPGSSYIHSYKYNPLGMVRDHEESEMISWQMNHMLNKNAFYDLKFSYSENWFGRYHFKDPLNRNYLNPNYSASAGGFSSGGIDTQHSERFTEQYMGKWDITWQVDKNHNIKSGIQFTRYRIENKPIYIRDIAWNTPAISASYYDPESGQMIFKEWEPELYPEKAIEMDHYVKRPYDFAAYLQDKMEFSELVVNYGIRYDYFNSNTVYPTNRQNPANQGEYDDPSFMSQYLKAEPQTQISPRLGLSYTLGTSAVLHFSYGHFFQMPPFFALYENYRFMIPNNDFNTSHGNATIDAQKTVKYEMGLWQELMPGLGLEVSVYYSDIYDLLTAVVWTTYNQIRYAVYDNKDYANSKGLEVKLDYTSGPVSLTANYTLQYTRGNADNPYSTFNRLAENQDPVPTLVPLSWDQRHTMNMNLGYSRSNYSISLTGFLNSGLPYTIEPILESRLAKQNIPPNNATRPMNYRVDLQGHYDVNLTNRLKLRWYLYIKNLFDQLNETQVYGSTGRAYTTILGEKTINNFRSNYNTVYDQFANPLMYQAPREIRIGLGVMF